MMDCSRLKADWTVLMATSSTPMMVPMKLAQETRSLSSFSRCYPVVLQHGQLLAQPASCLRSELKGLYKAFARPLF